ncbi:MAG TPA: aromatic amino acid transport family protein, partial [Gammaproteobacteria bacterium]|nr:aromatic amino acid transport family protein [Gammaproteobacteria bacterium]
ITQNKWTIAFINGFSNIALTTSFLGVSLGLFDFLADGFKRANTRIHRTQTALLTFIPPFLFALIYPHGFVMALGYAAIFVAILEVILPPLMVWKLRQSTTLHSPYRAPGHPLLLALVLLLGIAIIVIELLNSLHLLPTF